MFPLKDDNPTQNTPFATITIILLCISVFLYQLSLDNIDNNNFILEFGMKPASLFAKGLPENNIFFAGFTIFSSMFMHGSFFHLAGNMLFLWIYGNNIEDSMGTVKFIFFYAFCGLAAAFLQAFITPDSDIPMIGASGAVSGVLSAYFLLFPRARVSTLVILFFFITIIKIPAGILIAIWFFTQLFNAYQTNPYSPGVAWYAHIGGFVMGFLLIPFFKRDSYKFFSTGTKKKYKRKSIRLRFRK